MILVDTECKQMHRHWNTCLLGSNRSCVTIGRIQHYNKNLHHAKMMFRKDKNNKKLNLDKVGMCHSDS